MSLTSLSPLDGRYGSQLTGLSAYFSEAGLIRYRVRVEIEWLLTMSDREELTHVRLFSAGEKKFLYSIVKEFDEKEAQRVKDIEKTTNHDVKSVEYYIKERIAGTSLEDMSESVHFCCTSEDITNLSYALMLKEGIANEWTPRAKKLTKELSALAKETSDIPMLTRTHGQPATPSTVGKELAVFVYRWKRQLDQLERAEYLGKFNGAVGSYNAHFIAYPDAPWEDISRDMVQRLGLDFNPMTTQIESHDYMAELFHNLIRFNNITLDFDRDMWTYISLDYFKQKVVNEEVGSSIMPHKVNPIQFENSEANLGISNSLLDHLTTKLPISRLQRDLSDSSALRNIGSALGYSVLALESTLKGLARVQINEAALKKDLADRWEVLAEAVQTVMRKAGIGNPYEKMKELTRGQEINQEKMQSFIQGLDLPEADKERLLALTPDGYIGIASKLIHNIDG